MGDPQEKKRPRRYRLYDKIPLTQRSVDLIIYAIVAAIVLIVLLGTFVLK